MMSVAYFVNQWKVGDVYLQSVINGTLDGCNYGTVNITKTTVLI